MRLVGLSALLFSAILVGCAAKSEPAAPAAPAGSEATSAPAEATPAAPAAPTAAPGNDALSVPPPSEPKKEEPKTDVILPSTEPAQEAPAPPAEEEKKEGSAAVQGPGAFAFTAAAEGWGTLTGRFVYDGAPPEPIKLEITKDQECCGKYMKELVDESLSVGPGGGIGHVFIYVRSKEAPKVNPELAGKIAPQIKIDNKHCRYEPHASVVWAGKQTVVFGNADPINHAVKIDPLNSKNPAINNQLPPSTDVPYSFVGEERIPVSISCGIHPWQKGWILPLEHPYGAVSAADGTFTIEGLPAGKHEFQVWQEKAGYLVAKPEWKRGRFEMEIKPGINDLGAIKVSPSVFEKK